MIIEEDYRKYNNQVITSSHQNHQFMIKLLANNYSAIQLLKVSDRIINYKLNQNMIQDISSLSSNDYQSPSQTTTINDQKHSFYVTKPTFDSMSCRPSNNRVKGVYCPKTNTFYSTQQPIKPSYNKKNTTDIQFWDMLDDIYQSYSNPNQLNIELEQIF